MEINQDFGQCEILDLDDRLGYGREDQRIGRARSHGIPGALEVALHMVEHRAQHAQIDKQRCRHQPECRQYGGAVELRHELAFAAHDGDEKREREHRSRGASERGQGIGEPCEQGRAAFARAGQQKRHAADQGHIIAHDVREHGMPFLRPPGEQPACAEGEHPEGRDRRVRLMARSVQRNGDGAFRPALEPTKRQGQRVAEEMHDPHSRGQPDKQGQEQGNEVGVGIAEHGTGKEARRERGEDAGAETGLHAAHAPRPQEDEQSHEAGHDRRQPEGDLRGLGACNQGEDTEQFGHGMSGAEFKPLSPGDPVVGVVRGEEHFITKAVFHILPRRPLLKAQQEGHGVGRYAEQKAEEPARYGAEGDVS